MTTEEFSNNFDVLLNSYKANSQFGEQSSIIDINLDEYEKSVFLTNAQEELVESVYSGKNPFRDSFEKTEEVRRYLSNLTKTYKTSNKEDINSGLSDNSVFFKLPDDLWFITYEAVNLESDNLCANGKNTSVTPITQDEYHKIKNNPFRGSNKRRALRLDLGDNMVEIISKYNVEEYLVRYLSRPTPIILVDLPDGLTINNESNKTDCKLNSALHRTILERAVQLALISKGSNVRKE